MKGIVVHKGASLSSGHYVAFVKDVREWNCGWWMMSDDQVERTDITTALNQQAYILFYEKVCNAEAGVFPNQKQYNEINHLDVILGVHMKKLSWRSMAEQEPRSCDVQLKGGTKKDLQEKNINKNMKRAR